MNFYIYNIIYTYLYIQIYLSYIFIKLKILMYYLFVKFLHLYTSMISHTEKEHKSE